MTRLGYFWLLLLAVPGPVFALSPALTNALQQIFNAQLIAGLVLLAVVAIWVPHFIKRVVASQVGIERNVASLDKANYAALSEVDRRSAVIAEMQAPEKPYLDDVSDADFHTAMRAAGWSAIGAVPDPAGYDFAYELDNRISGLQAMAPSAPGQELGWGEEEFDVEDQRQAELESALHIASLSEAAWQEFHDDVRGNLDDELDGGSVDDEWYAQEVLERSVSLVSFLPVPVFEYEPDPLDQPT